jgi:hypothetical protein
MQRSAEEGIRNCDKGIKEKESSFGTDGRGIGLYLRISRLTVNMDPPRHCHEILVGIIDLSAVPLRRKG